MEELNISWRARRARRNDQLSVSATANQPVVNFSPSDNAYYLLAMTDLDAPYPERPEKSPLLHWLIVNFRKPGISTGEVLAEYMGPNPPADSATHRYLFQVFKQDGRIEAEPITDRTNFNIQQLARRSGISLSPVADNQIRVAPEASPPTTQGTAAKSVNYSGGRYHHHKEEEKQEQPEESDWVSVDSSASYHGGRHTKLGYKGGRRYIVETEEEEVGPEVTVEQLPSDYYPREDVETRRVIYTAGRGRTVGYSGGARKPRGKSHDPAAFCRAALHVEAKNDPSCEAKDWPRSERCYNPYAVSAASSGTTVGRGTCAPYIDPRELDDADLAAYVRLTNHKLREKGLELIPTDLSRAKTLAAIEEVKPQLRAAEARGSRAKSPHRSPSRRSPTRT
jgi:phosphatidylethanolamine-binding protein (PEBP) family uncharacterized protein